MNPDELAEKVQVYVPDDVTKDDLIEPLLSADMRAYSSSASIISTTTYPTLGSGDAYEGDPLEGTEVVTRLVKGSREIKLPEPITITRSVRGSQIDCLFDIIEELIKVINDYKGGLSVLE